PALAIPVTQVHADVEISASPRDGIWIEAPDVNLQAELGSLPPDHPLAAVIHRFFPQPPPRAARGTPAGSGTRGMGEGISIKITSTIPVAAGLGSGAAVSVALIRALSSHLGQAMTNDQVNGIAYEIEKIHHGTPSGIDNTVITYARPVFFIKGRAVEPFRAGKPFTIVIGDTGISAPTKEAVGDVRKLWEADMARWEKVFDAIGDITRKAKENIESQKPGGSEVEAWKELGGLMRQSHALLQELSVSSPELDRLVGAACRAGAWGAKMSGGGRGGNMIALVRPEMAEAVSRALKEAGARNTIITTIQP
ncbi:MAG TPA: mevalonate kinase, partial [Anaerolineales bacterium]|nr:mevalonate kinase [Anaerolineales bacterium]